MSERGDSVQQFYDDDAKRYDERWQSHGGRFNLNRQLDVLSPLLEELRGTRILEIGPGKGRFSVALTQYVSSRLTLADLSSRMLHASVKAVIATTFSGSVEGAQCSVQQLPFRESAFDGVLCINVLNHVPDLERSLHEIMRVLRPGGRAVLSFMNRRSIYWPAATWVRSRGGRAVGTGVYSRWDSATHVLDVITTAGGDIVERRGHVHVPRSLELRPLVPIISLLDRWASSNRLGRLAPVQYVAVIKRASAR